MLFGVPADGHCFPGEYLQGSGDAQWRSIVLWHLAVMLQSCRAPSGSSPGLELRIILLWPGSGSHVHSLSLRHFRTTTAHDTTAAAGFRGMAVAAEFESVPCESTGCGKG